ncbi:MAG: 1-deoxy-D-xylulose-5-phosphate reductoisomerase [Candidatus Omnitrophica bacterium]|nr:1-deoxy-D-xylulose-5-phosphate reductoisomerase [Candidatus Omnitrophota bacterium]
MKTPKRISILGSTGSIGINTLRIVESHPKQFRVVALAARRNFELLYVQARKFHPDIVCLYDETLARHLEKRLKPLGIRLVVGDEGLHEVSTWPKADQVICAMVGAAGLGPIFSALRARKALAIANKEPLVVAGELLMKEARRLKIPVFPIDSEHSALWQCLEGRQSSDVKKLVLTSSGGPFRTKKGSFAGIRPQEALRHPKWKMGPKITIDSATLMNKGLEVIEAANLFSVPVDKIDVLIHPEAIVHAMVELADGSFLAHLGITDMRLPIQYALSYPERLLNHLPTLDFAKLHSLSFEKPNGRRFPCLELGYEASRVGRSMPACLNAANEIAVEAFLNGRISFNGIPRLIEKVMSQHRVIANPSLLDLLSTNQWAREKAKELV